MKHLLTAHCRVALALSVAGVAGLSLAASPLRSMPTPTPMLAPNDRNSDNDNNSGRDGSYKSDEEHAKDIRWLLADVADRAAQDNGWERVSDWLSSNDRHRIADGLREARTGDYADYARRFREAWHHKYGTEFNAHKNMDDITGVKIDFNTEGGRKFAKATFPSFGGMQAFEMRLQLEAKDKWRIEIPNDIDAQKFVDSLQAGLKNIVDNKASLFDDEKLGLNSVITQMVHGLSFEPGTDRASAQKRK